MFWTFIFGIIAGAVAPFVEAPLKPALASLFGPDPIPPVELRVIAFAVCMLVVAIVTLVFGSSHSLPLTMGAAIGVLGPRIWDRFKAMRSPDYDS